MTEIEVIPKKARIGYNKNGQPYFTAKITSKDLMPFIDKKIKIIIKESDIDDRIKNE